MRLSQFIAAASMVLAGGHASAAPHLKYVITNISVTDLGTLLGSSSDDYSVAEDINDFGDIVGYSETLNNKKHAFIYTGGQMYDIQGPGPEFVDADAHAINNSRVVVGEYRDPFVASANSRRAFYYYPGIWMTPIPKAVNLWTAWSDAAQGINDAGSIVGWSRSYGLYDGPYINPLGFCTKDLAVRWTHWSTTPANLFCTPNLPQNGQQPLSGPPPIAYDINSAGNIVGADGGLTPQGMFLWNAAQQVMMAVPTFDGAEVEVPDEPPNKLFGVARGLNDQNWVVGAWGYVNNKPYGPRRAFVWDGTSSKAQALGALPGGWESEAEEINNQYMVAGWAERDWIINYQGHKHPMGFIWHPDFGMVALPGISGTFVPNTPLPAFVPNECEAYSLNDRKPTGGLVQVVGKCDTKSQAHAVRWDITVQVQLVP